jgi:hypothetical protein
MFRAAIALAEEHEARQRQTLLGEKFCQNSNERAQGPPRAPAT